MKTILVIEDNKYLQFALSAILEDSGYKTITATDSKKALKFFTQKKPDLILLDKKILDGDSFELLRHFKTASSIIPVIMLTAYSDEVTRDESLKNGADVFMTKPFDNDEIILTVKNLLKANTKNKALNAA